MLLNNIKFEVNITKLKYFLLLLLIFFSINLQSQAEASNWHFGYGAGLTFNLGDGTVTPNNDAQFTMNTNEGCSSISDFNGNLLFYTDGRNVWDRNHNVMPNADYNSNPDNGLLGDPSSTSSGLIVPKPGNPNQYYIFAVDEPHHQNAFAFPNQGPADEFGNPIFDYDSGGSIPGADDGFNNGLTYSLVDLELNSGNGDVVGTEKNIELITYDQSDQGESSYKCSEKITAIEHADGQSYWVLTQFVNKFYAFRVDETGVNPNPIVTTIEPLISFQGYRRNGIGYMKASPNGEKIAVAHRQNGDESGGFSFNTGSVWLYDFDSATGELSNAINAYPNFGPYGVEFSPDSSKLYVTGDSSVIQFDLDAQGLVPFVVYNGFDFIGAIQLGPDGKIYVANSEDYNSLDVINSPNLNADDCDYVTYEIGLASNTFASIGLPPFIQSFFLASITAENFCAGSVTTFSVNSNQTFDNISWDFGDGIGTSNSENPSYVYVNSGEYTVSATITAGTETIEFSEIIQINHTPTANTVEDLFECDDDNDGVLSFDFAESQNQVLAGQDSTAFSVTFHSSQEDADTNTNALAIPYFNTDTTEQIFVRIENNANTSCFDTTSFNLNVFDTPVANTVQTYEVCDDLNDGDDANGQTEVILTDFNNEVLNGQDADLFDITYHLSQEDADTNTNAIVSPYYNNGAPFSYQVFVRIENSLKVECYSTTEFTINIYTTPTANTVEDLFECDDDNDGVLSFDFAESQNQVLAGQDSTAFSVTFHSSQEDADTNTNALAIPYFNTDTTEQIFVRIENNANTSCFDTTSFNLNVFDTPVANTVQTYEVCDDLNDGDDANGQTEVILTDFNNEVLNGQDADLFDITYHLSQEDADTNTNAIVSPYYNNGAPFSYQVFVRIENSLKVECYSTTEFTINIYTTPTANTVEDLFECDDDNDGVLSFDFAESQNQVLAGQDSTAFSVTFHSSQEDADTNTNALAIPYFNTDTTEQIFVRIENNANTSCFDTTSFNLNVFDTPVANTVQTYEVCDDLNDGDDANGQTEVILTDFNNEVLNGQDADLFDITYHLSQEDADTNTNAIVSPYYNNGAPFSYQVFVRIENSLKVECYSTTEFTINIYTTPTANTVEDLFECDDDNDGVLSFDFAESQNQVLAGQDSTAFSVTFHSSQEDADTNTNALAIPYFNTDTTEQIFVRIENNANTSCFDTTSFNLNVFDTPVANTVQTYEVCDDLNDGDDANGQTEVILTDFNNEVLNGQDADLFDITYHLSQEDADTNTNAIVSPYYNNGAPFSYQVFVRIENSLKVECYSTTEFTINIYTTPTANTVEDLFECDDDNDGVLSFDFAESQNQVLAGQDSTAFSVTFHSSQEDADTNTNALAIPYFNTDTTEQIFVRIENNANTSCFDTTSFNLNVFDTPVANTVQTYEVCDDLNDGDDANGQTEVILTDFNNEVLNGQDADLFDITYHLSQEDADTNTNAIVSPYYNNGAPFSYQVFVRIENSLKVECYSTTEFTINIYTTPTANTVEDLFECDDDNDGVLSFDFAESQNQVLAGQDSTAFSVTFHSSQEDADTNTNALAIPYFNTDTTEQIFVRIENNANTSCFDTTSFNLNVFDTPVGTTNIEYYQCDYNNPGDYTEVFDLSSLNSEIINGQNVTISHYETFNDAENESNPITGPYTNLSTDQSIYYLLISNIYSECRFIGTYTIGVDPLPNVIENVPLVQCDIDGVQDGISIYNLEEAAENIVVGDDPENYLLTFHTSQEDLDANLNAITNPNSYVNLTPLQTIYTRVENINTTCYTTSYFYLETIFNPIPEDAGLIVCDNSEMNGNDYDGLGLFTLSDADDYILSMIVANPNNDITSPDQLTVKYYASENDALLELNQLPDQYISEVPNQQTLYIRVERENDCFGINSMLLQVFSVPEFNDIQDEILCTNTPGEAEVDLLDYNEIILGSQNENDIIISYHSSQEDADNGVNSLNSPYTVVDQQTIYVREEIQNNDPDVTGCFITNVNFTLTVESIPDFFQPENPELCDDDYDGIQTFDLSELDQQVIGGQTDLTISYHLSIEDAIENINLLPIIFTNTIQDNQTIFIRIENNITGCYETGSTNLIVNPKPFINTLQPYEVCDDNVDLDSDSTNNSVEFDLLSQNSAVLGGQDPLLFNVTYYLTEEDALNSSNSLNSQYTNEINPQTIYTRLDNLVNGCFEVAPLTLKVNPLPVVFIDNEYLLCVNTNGTEIIPPLEIDTGLENSAYTFIWSNLNGEIVGTDSSFFPSQGGDYFLEVFDSTLDTQCAAPIETFTVFESSPPIVTAEVTTPAFASIHIIEAIATGSGVYEFSLDQGPWQDSGLFYDISPGEHTVTVRDINGCGESKETLYVIDYPRFFTPNGDGYNDLWNIKGISNQQEAKIYIFDRYGKLLKEIRPSGRGWDGTYNGNLMPTNDYWFTLYYKDPTTGENKQLSAHFTLKT